MCQLFKHLELVPVGLQMVTLLPCGASVLKNLSIKMIGFVGEEMKRWGTWAVCYRPVAVSFAPVQCIVPVVASK